MNRWAGISIGQTHLNYHSLKPTDTLTSCLEQSPPFFQSKKLYFSTFIVSRLVLSRNNEVGMIIDPGVLNYRHISTSAKWSHFWKCSGCYVINYWCAGSNELHYTSLKRFQFVILSEIIKILNPSVFICIKSILSMGDTRLRHDYFINSFLQDKTNSSIETIKRCCKDHLAYKN